MKIAAMNDPFLLAAKRLQQIERCLHFRRVDVLMLALVSTFCQIYGELKQRMIAERFGCLDEGLMSRARRAIRERSRLNRRSETGFGISPG
jgi:hypothetical protein